MRIIVFALTVVFFSCSSNKELNFHDSFHESVVISLKNGKSFQGFVKDISNDHLIFILKNSNKATKINRADIHQLKKADEFYDQKGYKISEELINKEKSAENRILYSLIGGIGGGLVGGLAGGLSEKSTGENKNMTIGAAAGFLAGGIYGYTIGKDEDLKQAIEDIRAKRQALEEIKKLNENKE